MLLVKSLVISIVLFDIYSKEVFKDDVWIVFVIELGNEVWMYCKCDLSLINDFLLKLFWVFSFWVVLVIRMRILLFKNIILWKKM